jgi:hypothetical protein
MRIVASPSVKMLDSDRLKFSQDLKLSEPIQNTPACPPEPNNNRSQPTKLLPRPSNVVHVIKTFIDVDLLLIHRIQRRPSPAMKH